MKITHNKTRQKKIKIKIKQNKQTKCERNRAYRKGRSEQAAVGLINL